ncbi:CehA/McbA family metallohydrolase [Pseudothermotoga thermarum]|uniref:PHP domain protein n=1 Tax=Pseudothermotoga thermarum DSM 5069 TaxID=688269 RepID=F7YYS9_9THEM|nr:CehA/McbA family metallohydrolase [Pseudothermotoga thermarum]AEH51117.1 PHP domain protein [Pseudothermotoga thermarum DSM 5069]
MKRIFLIISFILVACAAVAYNFFFANLHSHTSYSDGVGTPKEAYEYAKNYLDVLAITDHAYYFESKMDGQDKLLLTKMEALKATEEEKFVALWGFEWTGGVGHMNVYGTDEWMSRNNVDLFGLYRWIVEKQALAQFNHPTSSFGTFYDFEYDPVADEFINLIEVGNGSWRGRTITDEMITNFVAALNKGWHLGATANQDNHRANWGSANDTRTVILAKELTYDSIMEALRNRRVYASEDKTVKLIFEANGYPMGSILQNVWDLNFKIKVEDDEKFEKISLISQSGTLAEWLPNSEKFEISYTHKVPDVFEWYFVYAVQKDGDRIISSPIWVHNANVYAVNTKVTAVGKNVELFFDLVNFHFEPEDVFVTAKIADREESFQVFMNGKEKKSKKISFESLAAGFHKLELWINGKIAFTHEVKVTAFTVILDQSHENVYPEIEELLKTHLKDIADVKLNSRYFRKIPTDADLIVIPLPKSGAFKEAAELNSFEIESLKQYLKTGGKVLIVALKDSIFEESYQKLVKTFEVQIDLKQILENVSTECEDLVLINKSGGFVFLNNFEKLVEILKGMVE